MPDWFEKLTAQLDKDQPFWYVKWASQQALQQFAIRVISYPQDIKDATESLRDSGNLSRMHRIINAGLGAGIISEVKPNV